MPWLNAVLLFYALLIVVMGILGFVNKGSLISLIAGTLAAVIIAGSLVTYKKYPRNSRITALVVAVLLLGKFSSVATSHKIYPDGIMFACSLVVVLSLIVGHIMGMKGRKAREAEEAAAISAAEVPTNKKSKKP